MDLRAGQQERPGQALAEGQKVTDTIVITVDDGKGGKATQTVTVEVTGTNDAPTIGGTATGAVKEDAVVNTTSGQLTKTDVDTNDVHTWSVANNGNGQYGKFTVDQTGKWTYTLDNSNAKVRPWPKARRRPTPSSSRSMTARAARRPRKSPSPSPAPTTPRP